jgi:hypothetical protein
MIIFKKETWRYIPNDTVTCPICSSKTYQRVKKITYLFQNEKKIVIKIIEPPVCLECFKYLHQPKEIKENKIVEPYDPFKAV